MVHGRSALMWASTLLALGLSAQASKYQTPAQPEVVPGEYVVQMRGNAVRNMMLLERIGTVVDQMQDGRAFVVRVDKDKKMVAAIQSLQSVPGVEVVEPNFIYRALRQPNDPDLAKLWGMHNEGQKIEKYNGVAGIDIGAVNAWAMHTGSRDMVVAVIDTGIDFNNEDLKDNMWVNQAEANGQAGVDDDNNGYIDDVYGYDFANNRPNGMDDQGHGTHCAGTIGATGDNGKSIVGVMWQVRMMPVKFLDSSGSGSLGNAVKAIDYAVKNGAKVLSNSWGGGGFSRVLEQSIKNSHEAGTLFVAAAGNDSSNNDASPTYPANYDVPNIISVAAINNRGELADFSCYGRNTVHVGAPGVDVYSTIVGRKAFDYWSGTSMATPHVSGVAGLVWSKETGLTNLQVKERLLQTARPLASLRGKVSTGGMVNAEYALSGQVPPPDANDPSAWPRVPFAASSPHPYPANANLEFEVEMPAGVERFAIHFARFELERRFDFLDIFDESGNKVASLTGRLDDSFSPTIRGRKARLVLRSDHTVQQFGFEIDFVAVGPQKKVDPPAEQPPAETEPKPARR